MSATQWRGAEHNDWQPSGPTTDKLVPAIYKVHLSPWGLSLRAFTPQHDNIIIAEDSVAQQINAGIIKFHNSKEKYKKYGLLHKRGILMHGEPGTGKTLTALLVAIEAVNRGGIVLFVPAETHFAHVGEAMQTIRALHPNLPILNIMEDIDKHNLKREMETLLSILDGENQIDNVVHIAVTNYINNLDSRITNRPSRFDEVVVCGPPSEVTRRSFLTKLVPLDEQTPALMDSLTKESAGLLMAHLHEMVVAHLVLGQPLTDVIVRLMDMQKAEAAQMASSFRTND